MISYKRKEGSIQIASDGKIPIFLDVNQTNKTTVQTTDAFPSVQENNDRILISGPSGAGKSTWVGNYIKLYKKKYPKRKVYLISSILQDDVIDKYKVIRIPLDLFIDEENEIDPEDTFTNSLVIFDDVDTICDNMLRKTIISLRDFMLEQSRHYDTHLLCTTHILMNGKETRRLLNEGSKYVLFPNSNTYQITNFLRKYIGLQQKSIDRFVNTDRSSRWKMISRDYPLYVVGKHEVYPI
jgi:predicted AAA+ superfamily ATPase